MNLNLIIDEEVFFGVAGQQDVNFNQQWLNFIQIPAIPAGTYSLPLNGQAPIPQYGPPVPLVVTAIDANGSPNYVYPIANQGVTATDPILAAAQPGQSGRAEPDRGQPDQGGVRPVPLAAAWRLGLSLRFRGRIRGTGYAVVPIDPPIPAPAGYGQGIPVERPFRSLSFPDIDYTVMRPATLPPSPFSNPPSTDPNIYTADPGVRNPQLYPGYTTQNAPTGFVAASGGTPAYPGAVPSAGSSSFPTPRRE